LTGAGIFNVKLFCSTDNGNTWGKPLQKVSGDVGGSIVSGRNKTIVWDVLQEQEKLTGDIKFRIEVENNSVFIDPRDRQKYKIVNIGNQIWFAENLNYQTKSSWCYDNDPVNCKVYGRLYEWKAAIKACPTGWHLPTDDEWKILEMYLGMSQSEADESGYHGTDEGKKMKSTSGWYHNGNGTNSSGFNALTGGNRTKRGSFHYLGYYGIWWSSSEYSGTLAWYRYLFYGRDRVRRYHYHKVGGFSVRCLKN
jgi:uncharacterized protein (TIGR02145 family)